MTEADTADKIIERIDQMWRIGETVAASHLYVELYGLDERELDRLDDRLAELVVGLPAVLDFQRVREGGMTTCIITFDAVTDEHIRLYQESMPDSPATRDVIKAARSDLPALRWLGRRRIATTINARVKAAK